MCSACPGTLSSRRCCPRSIGKRSSHTDQKKPTNMQALREGCTYKPTTGYQPVVMPANVMFALEPSNRDMSSRGTLPVNTVSHSSFKIINTGIDWRYVIVSVQPSHESEFRKRTAYVMICSKKFPLKLGGERNLNSRQPEVNMLGYYLRITHPNTLVKLRSTFRRSNFAIRRWKPKNEIIHTKIKMLYIIGPVTSAPPMVARCFSSPSAVTRCCSFSPRCHRHIAPP